MNTCDGCGEARELFLWHHPTLGVTGVCEACRTCIVCKKLIDGPSVGGHPNGGSYRMGLIPAVHGVCLPELARRGAIVLPWRTAMLDED